MKKGFTLLELLAVIIILAVIALIATPVVLNIVDNAKKSAFESSANGLIDAIGYKVLENQLSGNSIAAEYIFPSIDITVHGKQPDGGTAKVDSQGRVQIAVHDGKWCATKDFNDEKITVKEYVEGECVIVDNELTQLASPTISLADNILYISPNDNNTTGYEIYVDEELQNTILNAASEKTNRLSGTWVFNDTIFDSEINESVMFMYYSQYLDLGYSSDGIGIITDGKGGRFLQINGLDGNYSYSFANNEWYDSVKTIVFEESQEVTAEFFNWFTTNAKQAFDLSTLNLDAGSHSITVRAVAENYSNSIDSNVVTYEVALIPGLYETGTTILKTSWEDLITNGIIVSDNGTITTPLDDAGMLSKSADELSGELILPNDGSVMTIGSSAFAGCKNLTNITIPESVIAIESYAFSNCTSLTDILIPNRVINIGNKAFENCDKLTNVTIPDDVKTIGIYAFSDCDSLESVIIGSNVESIGIGIVSYCPNLSNIYVSQDNNIYHSAGNSIIKTADKTLIAGCKNTVIPNDGSVIIIDGYSFEGCSSLISITIPDSVISIGGCAFYKCNGLVNVLIGNNVETIGGYAFAYCTDLKDVIIPSSVTTIGGDAFESCTSLTSIIIPDSVISIGIFAFSYCRNLATATIGNGVTEIASNAFFSTGLTSVDFKDTSTWYYGTYDNMNDHDGGTKIDVSNASEAAIALKSTYRTKYWYKN